MVGWLELTKKNPPTIDAPTKANGNGLCDNGVSCLLWDPLFSEQDRELPNGRALESNCDVFSRKISCLVDFHFA